MRDGELGRDYADGEVIIRQGDPGDCMYVIQEGQAEVWVDGTDGPMLLRTVTEGDILGEMAIFEKVTRSATVRARGPVRALTVDKRTFLQRVHADPSLAWRVCQTLSQRVRDLSGKLAHYADERGGATQR